MKTIITFYLLLFALTSCNKDDDNEFKPTLPPITQTGENTFGCYIDGNLLTPRDGTGTYLGSDDGMSVSSFDSDLESDAHKEIRVRDFKDSHGIIKIHLANINSYSVGDYTINSYENGFGTNINISVRWNSKWYYSTLNSGTLHFLKIDNLGNYAGTFNCTIQNIDNPNDSIEITQGRFDIYSPTLRYVDFP